MGNVIVVNSGVACEEAQRGGQLLTMTVVQSNSILTPGIFQLRLTLAFVHLVRDEGLG